MFLRRRQCTPGVENVEVLTTLRPPIRAHSRQGFQSVGSLPHFRQFLLELGQLHSYGTFVLRTADDYKVVVESRQLCNGVVHEPMTSREGCKQEK